MNHEPVKCCLNDKDIYDQIDKIVINLHDKDYKTTQIVDEIFHRFGHIIPTKYESMQVYVRKVRRKDLPTNVNINVNNPPGLQQLTIIVKAMVT